MGLSLSAYREKKTCLEILEDLEKKIIEIENDRQTTMLRQRKYVGRLIIYSILLYFCMALAFYLLFFPSTLKDAVLYLFPLIVIPVLVTGAKKILNFYFVREIAKRKFQLIDLRAKKKKILDEVMDKETFRVAKEVLEKFAPDQLAKCTSLNDSCEDLNKCQDRKNNGINSPVSNTTEKGPKKAASTNVIFPSLTVSSKQSLVNQTPLIAPHMSKRHLVRPIVPARVSRGLLERLLEYLVGDGPSNRFALICTNCYSHNGMALKEEFEHISFRCAYCGFPNPSRRDNTGRAVSAITFYSDRILLDDKSVSGPEGSKMFPYKIKPVEEEVNKELVSLFKGERTGFCETGPQKWVMPAAYENHAEAYYTFPLRKDDVWVVTFPRSGTTVTQELVWMLVHDFDYETSSKKYLGERSPFLEFHCAQHSDLIAELKAINMNDPETLSFIDRFTNPAYEKLSKMHSPRLIKTHLPFSLLPPTLTETCKTVYVARNPRDVVESYYHHNKLIRFHDYVGDFEKYWDLFERNLLLWCPYWEHIKEGWERRNNPNVYFLFYEDLIKGTPGTIKNIANFLNKTVTDKQVEDLANHLEINNFREKVYFLKPINGLMNNNHKQFIRKGKTGKSELYTEELMKRSEQYIQENIGKVGIIFPE